MARDLKDLVEAAFREAKVTPRFGEFGSQPNMLVAQVEPKEVLPSARALRDAGWVFLEALTASESRSGKLQFSCFLRTETLELGGLVLRWSSPVSAVMDRVDTPSVQSVWIRAELFEGELGALYGVRFQREDQAEVTTSFGNPLPPGWEGFPLRKRYVFPIQFLEIPHSRPAGHAHGVRADGGAELPS